MKNIINKIKSIKLNKATVVTGTAVVLGAAIITSSFLFFPAYQKNHGSGGSEEETKDIVSRDVIAVDREESLDKVVLEVPHIDDTTKEVAPETNKVVEKETTGVDRDTAADTTTAPETQAPVTTKAPETTKTPETKAPETAPVTKAPETQKPEPEGDTKAPITTAPETKPQTSETTGTGLTSGNVTPEIQEILNIVKSCDQCGHARNEHHHRFMSDTYCPDCGTFVPELECHICY